ncbi:Crp/Fnr family transcriptional regulator [Embleya sp. NPDC005575]|uniref:Crp/Fnr family transcriptional regulator n=1 Tax=Embleya sp. NPDC005575 TaxID=3156892 RepID=UPI0033B4D781
MAAQTYQERLGAAEAAEWRRIGRVRRYTDGDRLMREGEPATEALFLAAGRVKVVSTAEDGREVVLAYRQPGEVFGEIAALDRGPHSATVIAIGDVSAWSLTTDQFLLFLDRQPRVAISLLMVMTRRLRQADAQRLNYRARNVLERMAERLLTLCEQCGEEVGDGRRRVAIRVTMPELGASVAAGRESAVKAFARLREMGAVSVDPARRFVIEDAELLARLAAGRAGES